MEGFFKKLFKKTTLVLICFLFFSLLGFKAQAASAVLYLSPSSGSFNIGKTFSVSVYVSSTEQNMNAVSGVISFPNDKLEATAISKSVSFISLWVQEPSLSSIRAHRLSKCRLRFARSQRPAQPPGRDPGGCRFDLRGRGRLCKGRPSRENKHDKGPGYRERR